MKMAQTYMDMLEDAIAADPYSETTLDGVMVDIAEGRAKLWLGVGCCAVTNDGPRGKLHVWLAGGDMERLMGDLLPQARAYAAENSYSGMSLNGRFGWIRALKEIGAKPVSVLVEF